MSYDPCCYQQCNSCYIPVAGPQGPPGAQGIQGVQGIPGTNGSSLGYALFYALMPPDNAATVAAGTAVSFPRAGPTSASSITSLSGTTFQLAAIGTYQVNWQVSVTEPGQLDLALNGVEQPYTVVGRATGTSQITGSTLITTTTVNSTLSVFNPVGNSPALTITPTAGGTHAVSASLLIIRIA
jgi:hypothetical protein